jgi:hypothetical protein
LLPGNASAGSAAITTARLHLAPNEDHPNAGVEMAVLADTVITEQQKRLLIDIYASFVKVNAAAASRQVGSSN